MVISGENARLISRQIDQMESANQFYRLVLQRLRLDMKEIIREFEDQNGRFPPLPSRLPRPEYALAANILNRSPEALEFYWACEQGDMDAVVSFVEREGNPPVQGTLQYALEQASFACRVAVVQYLLTIGAILHTNCFCRQLATDKQPGGQTSEDVSILGRFWSTDHGIPNNANDIAELLRAFAQLGSWHPNQAYEEPHCPFALVAICTPKATCEPTILKLLLDLGADPNLGRHTGQHAKGSRLPYTVSRQCPTVLNEVVQLGDVAALQLVLDHGAQTHHEKVHLLHSIVMYKSPQQDPPFLEGRRQVAQYLLDHGISEINEVKPMHSRPKDWRMSAGYIEQETALTRACAASDWKFVEWLLDHGADPEALNRKAYTQQWWYSRLSVTNYNDPSRLVALVEKRKKELEEGTAIEMHA
ncbi:hypothetical protein F5Y18DRAFT_308183 [Xylariaceae sp. FL1019]|nr:hypothetical protein F5Y18DRAFT_308183 [Xylariaceae sp. FL1019]